MKLLVIIVSLFWVSSAYAQVQVGSSFSPASITIKRGEALNWNWSAEGSGKTVTSTDSREVYDSGAKAAGESFSHLFTKLGTFSYQDQTSCASLVSPCLTGSVSVVNQAPTVSLTASASSLELGNPVSFTASASDPDGSYSGPLSYAYDPEGDGSFIAGDKDFSFKYLSPGTYHPAVRVTDPEGASATSSLNITVTAPALNAQLYYLKSVRAGQTLKAFLVCNLSCEGSLRFGNQTQAVKASGFFSFQTKGLSGVKNLGLTLAGPWGVSFTTSKPVSILRAKPPKVPVGISLKYVEGFEEPYFKMMGFKRLRFMTPWNGIFKEPERQRAYLAKARAEGFEVLVTFEHGRGEKCEKRCTLPSLKAYAKAFKAFRKAYPWVRTLSVWNEVNHPTQPTYRNPKRAAQYYLLAKKLCRGCRLLAADLLDSSNLKKWAKSFLKTCKCPKALWGLHNYSDINRSRTTGIETLLKSVKGPIWLTETGGMVKFITSSGKLVFPYNELRAKRATQRLFSQIEKYPRIKRVYVYEWREPNPNSRFDSGLLDSAGNPRPALEVVKLKLH